MITGAAVSVLPTFTFTPAPIAQILLWKGLMASCGVISLCSHAFDSLLSFEFSLIEQASPNEGI